MLSGHCLCGAMRYTVDADPVATAICHCDDCQRQSGAAFSLNVVVASDTFALEGDTLKTIETTGTETKLPRQRQFCGTCGSPLVTLLDEMPGVVIIKAGTLDDRAALTPQVEVWCDSKQPWVGTEGERSAFATGLPAS
jgi:hypothetical protein